MDVGARAVHVGAWIAAPPAAAPWCALRLVWVVFAGEIAAALLAAAAAATHLARPGLSARGMDVFFWAEHGVGSAPLAPALPARRGRARARGRGPARARGRGGVRRAGVGGGHAGRRRGLRRRARRPARGRDR